MDFILKFYSLSKIYSSLKLQKKTLLNQYFVKIFTKHLDYYKNIKLNYYICQTVFY